MLIKYKANGMEREIREPVARALIRRKLATAVEGAHQASSSPEQLQYPPEAPYGYKADGTPRARPGRKASEPAADGAYNRRDMRAED